jgi:DNA-binding response OmpR family regulator
MLFSGVRFAMSESPLKVLAFLLRTDLKRRLEKALTLTQFVVDTVASAEECLRCSRFSQYDGILFDSDALLFSEALLMTQQLRRENSDTSLFVFARYLDLDQRLNLFTAGADDCVREPFFTAELAVRLRLSIKLRRAASNLSPRTP